MRWKLAKVGRRGNDIVIVLMIKIKFSPDWCVSLGWVPACELKGCRFNSGSGHMTGLWARSPFGSMQVATDVPLPLFLPPFPLSLKSF